MLNHTGTQTIETERLYLRRFTVEDAPAMYRNWASDPAVTKFMTWPTHESEDISRMVLESWVADYEKDDYYQWAIVLKELGSEPIGSISVVMVREKIACATIGYCIGKAWWHQGIMSEALQAVMEHLFDRVGFQRIEAQHDDRNPHSGGVMKKCGMRYEGTLRQGGWSNGGVGDICCYAMLKSDRK